MTATIGNAALAIHAILDRRAPPEAAARHAKRQKVIAAALGIARLMDQIVGACEGDEEIGALICEAFPFSQSLDEVSSSVITWRDAMAAAVEQLP